MIDLESRLFFSLAEFKQQYLPLWLLLMALFGLVIGSFLNVVICRLPILLLRNQRTEARRCLGLPVEAVRRFDLCVPASCCPHCGQGITPRHNIPLLSWILLRGRAACCGQPISVRYPATEGLMMLLFVGLSWGCPPGWLWLAELVFFSYLVALAFIDFGSGFLPDLLTLPLLWFGLAFNAYQGVFALQDAVFGAMAGYLSLWSLFHGFRLLSGKEGLGYGDFKFLAALGAWLGWQVLPALILLAAVAGLVVALLQRISARKTAAGGMRTVEIAFGPYLAAAAGVMVCSGQSLLNWPL